MITLEMEKSVSKVSQWNNFENMFATIWVNCNGYGLIYVCNINVEGVQEKLMFV